MPDTSFYKNPDFWSGAGSMASGIGGIFGMGGKNPAEAGMPYLNQIPSEVSKYYDPYINAGKKALPTLEEQYNQLLNSPGGKMNAIGQDFQQSPGFQFALQQALQGANQSAAAGGMAGSPMAEQNNMAIATQLGNQDYNNWIQHALGMYGQGLQGEQQLGGWGLNAGNSMADQIAQTRAAQAKLAYEGQAQKNQQQGSGFGDLLGGVAKLGSALFF